MKRLPVVLGIVLLLFAATRSPGFQRNLDWSTSELLTFGVVPHHMGRGLSAAPSRYLTEPQEGCSLIWGAACTPVFALAGPSRGSLRSCSLLWHAVVLLVLGLLAAELAGWQAALLLGLLWALAPPSLIALSRTGLVGHLDVTALTAGCLLCLARALADEVRRPGAWMGAAGLLASLALFFYFSAAMVLSAIGIAFLLSRRSGPWPPLLPGLGGLALGALAFGGGAGYWQHEGGRASLLNAARALVGLEPADPTVMLGLPLGERLVQGLTRDLPSMLGFQHGSGDPRLGAAALYGAALLVLALGPALLPSRRQPSGGDSPRSRRLVLHAAALALPLHMLGCLASGFDLSHGRYLLPLWPWATLLAAGGAAQLLQSSRSQHRIRAGLSLAAALLTIVLLFAGTPAGRTLSCRAADLPEDIAARRVFASGGVGYLLTEHPLGKDILPSYEPERFDRVLERHPEDAAELLRIRGWALARQGGQSPTSQALGRLAQAELDRVGELPPAAEAALIEGLGEAAGLDAARRWDEPTPQGVVAAAALQPFADPQRAERFALGAHRGSLHRVASQGKEAWEALGEAAAVLGPEEGLELCFALGLWAHPTYWTMDPLRGEAAWCPPGAFAAGFGVGLARSFGPVGVEPEHEPQLSWWTGGDPLPPGAQEAFACGWRAELPQALAVAGQRPSTQTRQAAASWTNCLAAVAPPAVLKPAEVPAPAQPAGEEP